jgi:glycine/D-amino acid oxidase-like deaminating enzyme
MMNESSRRTLLASLAALGGASLVAGCASPGVPLAGSLLAGRRRYDPLDPFPVIRAQADRIFRITTCLRPFRAAGPRLDTERVGDHLIVHNYGHGGSGWSLSWGSSSIAIEKALAGGGRDIGVIGAGALGMTSALLAQRAGARVTIYARERAPYVRSSRATGTWSPASRVALEQGLSAEFPAQWEAMCRTSYAQFQSYLGLAGTPVEWTDRYALSDIPFRQARAQRDGAGSPGFVDYHDQVRDLTPAPIDLPAGSHPFPTPFVRRSESLQFNIASLSDQLTREFLAAGGQFEQAEFHTPDDLTRLPQKTLINATGYGARALWRDDSIVPVRGQLAWLIPQPEVQFGISYRDVSLLARRDGIIVQSSGASDYAGYNDPNEQPDRAEAEAAVRIIAELYDRILTVRPGTKRAVMV